MAEPTPDMPADEQSGIEETIRQPRSIEIAGMKSHTVAVLVVILLAMGLIAFGIAVFGEDRTQRAATPSSVESTAQDDTDAAAPAEVDETSPVTPAVIDAELKALEQDIAEVDKTDFSEEEISDEALGL